MICCLNIIHLFIIYLITLQTNVMTDFNLWLQVIMVEFDGNKFCIDL